MSAENGAMKAFANLHARTDNQTFKNEVGEPTLPNPTLLPFDSELNPVALRMHLPGLGEMLYHDQLNSKPEPSSPVFKPLIDEWAIDEEDPLNPALLLFDPELRPYFAKKGML